MNDKYNSIVKRSSKDIILDEEYFEMYILYFNIITDNSLSLERKYFLIKQAANYHCIKYEPDFLRGWECVFYNYDNDYSAFERIQDLYEEGILFFENHSFCVLEAFENLCEDIQLDEHLEEKLKIAIDSSCKSLIAEMCCNIWYNEFDKDVEFLPTFEGEIKTKCKDTKAYEEYMDKDYIKFFQDQIIQERIKKQRQIEKERIMAIEAIEKEREERKKLVAEISLYEYDCLEV